MCLCVCVCFNTPGFNTMPSRSQSRSSSRGKSPNLSSGTLYHVMKKSTTKFPQIGNGQDGDMMGGNSILQIPNNSGLTIGVCTQQGKRPYQEDEFAIRPNLTSSLGQEDPNDFETHFFGLFDGHAGGRCSKHVAAVLPGVLAEDPQFKTNLPQAIRRSFHATNDQFLKVAEKMKIHDGSTGITSLIRGNKLLVANVGDCRTLVISGDRPVQMSIDQKPTTVEEQKRIASLGGTVEYCMGVARVNRVLAVSRAFGNRTLKSVIRPDAEMMQRELHKDDEYLIMASDGLWDVLKNKDVFDICKSAYLRSDPQAVADELVHTALSRGSMDNVTCICVRLTNYINRIYSKDNQTPKNGPISGVSNNLHSNAALANAAAGAGAKADKDIGAGVTAKEDKMNREREAAITHQQGHSGNGSHEQQQQLFRADPKLNDSSSSAQNSHNNHNSLHNHNHNHMMGGGVSHPGNNAGSGNGMNYGSSNDRHGDHDLSSKQWEEQGKRNASQNSHPNSHNAPNNQNNHAREDDEEAIRSLIAETGAKQYYGQAASKIPSINSRSFNLTGSINYQSKQVAESPPKFSSYSNANQMTRSVNNSGNAASQNPQRSFSPLSGRNGGNRNVHLAFGNSENGPTVTSAQALIDSHSKNLAHNKNNLLSQSLQGNSMPNNSMMENSPNNHNIENKNLNGISAYASLRRPNTSGGLSTKNGIVRPSMANISSLFGGGNSKSGGPQHQGGGAMSGGIAGGGNMDYHPQMADDGHQGGHPNNHQGYNGGNYFNNSSSFNKGQNSFTNQSGRGKDNHSKSGRPKSSTVGWVADGFGNAGISVGGVQNMNGYGKK